MVLSAIFFAVMIAFRSLMPSVFLHLTAAIGGCFTGLLAALRVSQPHPHHTHSFMHALNLSLTLSPSLYLSLPPSPSLSLQLMHKFPLHLPSVLYGVSGTTAATIVSIAPHQWRTVSQQDKSTGLITVS